MGIQWGEIRSYDVTDTKGKDRSGIHGKAAVPNTRICESGGASGWVVVATLTSESILARNKGESWAVGDKFSNWKRSQTVVLENGKKPFMGWRRTKYICDIHPLAHLSNMIESLSCERPRVQSRR